MKVSLFIFFLCLAFSAIGQQPKQDTIVVNNETTTYLIFDNPISMYNIGNKDYEAQVNNPKILFLKAKSSSSKPSTLVLTQGDNIYTAYLVFRKNAPVFYDFRKPIAPTIVENPEEKQYKILVKKLEKLQKQPVNVSFTTQKQNMVLRVFHLYNDNQATYLSLQLKNLSSMVYEVEYVSFAYTQKRKKSKQNVLASGMEDIQALAKIEPLRLEAGESNSFYYALPLYATTQDGSLQIIFREKAGLRSIGIEIPFKKILNADFL